MNWKSESDRYALARIDVFGSLERASKLEGGPTRARTGDSAFYKGRRALDAWHEERALQRDLRDVWD